MTCTRRREESLLVMSSVLDNLQGDLMAVSQTTTQQETPDTTTAEIIDVASPKPRKFNPSEIEEREYSETEYAELAKLYDKTFGTIHEGEIVKGKIVAISDDGVAIDIGFK